MNRMNRQHRHRFPTLHLAVVCGLVGSAVPPVRSVGAQAKDDSRVVQAGTNAGQRPGALKDIDKDLSAFATEVASLPPGQAASRWLALYDRIGASAAPPRRGAQPG